jgi:hypothetical protein
VKEYDDDNDYAVLRRALFFLLPSFVRKDTKTTVRGQEVETSLDAS